MEEFIKGIPLYPEEDDLPAIWDELDRIFLCSSDWTLFAKSPAAAAVKRALGRDQDFIWTLLYAFSLGHMAGIHGERCRRKAKHSKKTNCVFPSREKG